MQVHLRFELQSGVAHQHPADFAGVASETHQTNGGRYNHQSFVCWRRANAPILSCPTAAAFRGRNGTDVASPRRGQPRVVAGSVSAGVCRCLGLARRLVADRVPGVPPRSAAHPGLCTDGLPGRRRAATKCVCSRPGICSRPRVEDGRPVDRRLLSSSALLSPLLAEPPLQIDCRMLLRRQVTGEQESVLFVKRSSLRQATTEATQP